jgi:calcineurin-like phosphoesterase family protein
MNETLIKNWNSRVKPEDVVFHVGDFAYKSSEFDAADVLSRLNGQVILIKGNHDRNNNINVIIEDIRIRYGGKELLLIHCPEEGSMGYDLVLCGHVHDKWKFRTVTFQDYSFDCCNVGVDVWKYMPINIHEILSAYNQWKRSKN